MNENEKMIMQLSKDMATVMAILTGDLATMKDDVKAIQSELKQQSEKTSEITALRDRIAKLESTHIWFTRTILGLVIAAVMSLILIFNK